MPMRPMIQTKENPSLIDLLREGRDERRRNPFLLPQATPPSPRNLAASMKSLVDALGALDELPPLSDGLPSLSSSLQKESP